MLCASLVGKESYPMEASVHICFMSSFTVIRASVNFHALKTSSICPVNSTTDSQAKWVKFSYTCSMSSLTIFRANVNFYLLKTLSIILCPVNFRTNSQAKWVKFSYIYSISNI